MMNEEQVHSYHEESSKEQTKNFSLKISNLKDVGGTLLIAFAFLLPIFFIPSPFLNFTAGKIIFTVGLVLVGVLMLVMFLLKKGRMDIPKHPLLLSAIVVPFVYLISGALSVSGFTLSVAGYGSEVYTFSTILFFFLLFFLTLFFFQRNAHVFYFYLAVVSSSLVLGLFFILRFLFGPEFLSLGFFNVLGSGPLESWNGTGIFFGVIFVLSLFTFETFKMKPVFKGVLGFLMAFSLFFLVLTGIVWYWLAIAIVITLYIFFTVINKKKDEEAGVPFVSVISLFIAIAFVSFGSSLSSVISNSIGVTGDDLRPSLSATMSVTGSTLMENPLRTIVGAGPMDFSYQWMQHKPDGMLQSRFWNIEFGQGFSFLTSVPASVGLAGFGAWVIFFVLYLVLIFKGFFYSFRDVFTRYVFISSASVSVLLLMAMSMTLLPFSLLVYFFMFAAIPIGVLVREKQIVTVPIDFDRHTKTGSVYMSTAIILTGIMILFGAFVLQRNISGLFFEKSAFAFFAEDNTQEAEANFDRATTLSKQDRFYRVSAEFPIARIGDLVPVWQSGQITEEEFIQNSVDEFRLALARAQEAIRIKNSSYRNWLTLGSIYQEMMPFNTDIDAYAKAKESYIEAIKHNPKNPALYLQVARVDLIENNLEEAKQYNNQALEIKPNYANALFFNSQIAIAEEKMEEAEESITQAINVESFDPGLYFQRGILRYERDDIAGAANDFNRALRLSPNFDNAKYFLSLSLYQTEESEVAIGFMEELVRKYPDTSQLEVILNNMNSGVDDPLFGVGAFEEPTPELPVDEEISEIDVLEDDIISIDENEENDQLDDLEENELEDSLEEEN